MALSGFQVIERTQFVTDRRTDRQTDGRTDAWGKTICLPTLKGGDINTKLFQFCLQNESRYVTISVFREYILIIVSQDFVFISHSQCMLCIWKCKIFLFCIILLDVWRPPLEVCELSSLSAIFLSPCFKKGGLILDLACQLLCHLLLFISWEGIDRMRPNSVYTLLTRSTLGLWCIIFATVRALDLRHIMKTCLCNEQPLTPHFYIGKLGFAWVYIIFLFLL